jgi:hypothetical protein
MMEVGVSVLVIAVYAGMTLVLCSDHAMFVARTRLSERSVRLRALRIAISPTTRDDFNAYVCKRRGAAHRALPEHLFTDDHLAFRTVREVHVDRACEWMVLRQLRRRRAFQRVVYRAACDRRCRLSVLPHDVLDLLARH